MAKYSSFKLNTCMKRKSKYHTALCLFTAVLIAACEEKHAPGSEVVVDSAALNWLIHSPAEVVFSKQETVTFGDSQTTNKIVLEGIIVPDERRTNIVSVRFGGRVEKLYVRFPNQFVKQGQKLMEIYSPEITSVISEHLLLYSIDSASSLVNESRTRLTLLGIAKGIVTQCERTNIIPDRFPVFSPYSGYVTTVDNAIQSAPVESGMKSMNGGSMEQTGEAPVQSSLLLREGSYVVAGQPLFAINDGSSLIALLSLDAGMATEMKIGGAVAIQSEIDPALSVQGTISLVEPVLQPGQKFLNIRVEVPNENGKLKFNSLITANVLRGSAGSNLPASCVYDLGRRSIVWVQESVVDSVSVFTPRVVMTGVSNGGRIEIISGLHNGERVALQAGLLSDREGIIITDPQ